MEHKGWGWKKKSSEKNMFATDKVNGNEEQIQDLQKNEAELKREIQILSEKLSSALSECNAKDDLVKRNAKMAKEALGGWEKVEAEATLLKHQLDEVLIQKLAGDERITNLEMALKECMQQLRFVREEKEQRIHDVVTKTSREFEKTRILLEENLVNSNVRLSKLGVENSQLARALIAKERFIEDIIEQKHHLEADFKALITRLESTEKEKASLKYEVQVLEKEAEIRSEEREFNCRTADSAHKQHLESSKKIAKLESECQRLRVLVRKKLPGPAALAIMKSEVEMLGRGSVEPRRMKSNLSSTGFVDFVAEKDPDTPRRKITSLSEQLCVIEEENKNLKEALNKQTNELQFSQAMYNHTASKLSQFETQVERSSIGGQMTLMSEIGSEDNVNTPGSRASVLFSETNHFRNGDEVWTPSRMSVAGSSDIDLMDDFVEMEKLAKLSRKKPLIQSHVADISDRVIGDEKSLKKKASCEFQTNLSKSIQKTINLIEGSGLLSKDVGGFAGKTSETPGYTVRVFQWKTFELRSVLQNFIQTCNGLLTGKADLESFAEDLTSALDWVINHCFSLQDVSSMRDTIKKQFDWDETRSESEVEGGVVSHFSEANKLRFPREQFTYPTVLVSSEHKVEQKDTRNDSEEEKKKLKDELANMEGRLQWEISKNEALNIQLQEPEKVEDSRTEPQTVKKSKAMIQNQTCHNIIGETKVKDDGSRLKELEIVRVDSQPLLESVAHVETPKETANQEERQLRSDLKITTASEKLAECQETILNLGKQLKALASPQHLPHSEKLVINPIDHATTTTLNKTVSHHTTLLDKMMAEDNAEYGGLNFPITKDVICVSDSQERHSRSEGVVDCRGNLSSGNTTEHGGQIVGSFMAIVPSKKKGGGGFLKKLLSRKKKR